MSHLKRLNAPKLWPLKRKKGRKFIARPLPGPHKMTECMTINVILKEILHYANTTKESKLILNQGKILVDGEIRKDYKFPIGIMDVLSIKDTGENFILLYNENGKFNLHPIKEEEAEDRFGKIIGKTILKKKKTQLNFHNGNNLIVDKDTYKTGDTLIMNKNKITKHLKFEKGATIYLIGGKHKGKTGVLEKIESFPGSAEENIIIKTNEGNITTTKHYAFVIEKPFKK